jgi:predicted Zn-dependent protease
MSDALIANLEKLIDGPRDGALLRYSLGCAYLKTGRYADATRRLREATERDPAYTAAWKQLGKALSENGELEAALVAYTQGMAVAQAHGDIQAAKEMAVFSRRLVRQESGMSSAIAALARLKGSGSRDGLSEPDANSLALAAFRK